MITKEIIADIQPTLLTYARKFFPKSTDDAYDLAADTTIKLLKNIGNFQEDTNVLGFAYTIMKNTFINKYRKYKKVLETVDQEFDLYEMGEKVGVIDTNRALLVEMQEAIESLSEGYRVPLKYMICGYKYEEISMYLDLPVGTVKTRIHLARKQIQNILDGKVNKPKKKRKNNV